MSLPPHEETVDARVAALRESLKTFQRGGVAAGSVLSCGPDFDDLLPDRGFRRGSLVEWLGETRACGVETLSMVAAEHVVEDGGAMVVIDRDETCFPHGLAALGVDLDSLIVVRVREERAALWVFDEALRSPAVSVVWSRMDSLPGRSYRKLQLSAEEGGAIGFLIRPTTTVGQASWCDVGLQVESLPTGGAPRYRVEVVRSRDGNMGRSGVLKIDDHSRAIRATSDAAPSVVSQRA